MLNFQKQAHYVLAVAGMNALDASNSDEFKKALQPHVTSPVPVVLDLSTVNFIDSSGLGALLSVQRQLAANESDLKLCGLSRQARSLFQLVRLNGVFEVFNDQDEAHRALG